MILIRPNTGPPPADTPEGGAGKEGPEPAPAGKSTVSTVTGQDPPNAALTGRATGHQQPQGLKEPQRAKNEPGWAERYEALEQRMAVEPEKRHARYVRRFVRSLSPQEQAAIPLAVENDLVQLLLSSQVSGTPAEFNANAIRTLYQVATRDPAFEAVTQRLAEGLADRLNEDPIVAGARRDWDSMSAEQRHGAMQRVADLSSTGFGLSRAPIATYSEYRKRRTVTSGELSDGRVHVNVHPQMLTSFTEAIDTIVHESCHLYQRGLVEQLLEERVYVGDPRIEQMRSFYMNLLAYSDGSDDGDSAVDAYTVYRNQPCEDHAWSMAQRVMQALEPKPEKPE